MTKAAKNGAAQIAGLFVRLREDLGIGQVELSKRLGISQPTICRIEKGAIEPRAWALIRAARLAQAKGSEEVFQAFNRLIWGG